MTMRDRMRDDTTAEALAVQFRVLRRIGCAGRLAMTTQKEFLSRLIDLLNRAGIPYMVAGSVGSSLHGPVDIEQSRKGRRR